MFHRVLTLLMLLFASSFGFAQEMPYTSHDDEILEKIEANKNLCVAGYTENRIYLDPARIVPTKEGMYLQLNEQEFILLPSINSDTYGCYLDFDPLNVCKGCGQKYFLTCKNRDCPLVKRNEERKREKERGKEERKKEKEREKEKKKKK